MTAAGPGQNLLVNQQPLYLKQHTDHPVHWRPYGKEAIEYAAQEKKPIFLSIGYSSCHWCHVMAHESFEDRATADYLNEHFVCIKVDREEYPDLDHYYQQACQLFNQSGGWPLSAFLLPNLKPFFVGTYFPKVVAAEQGSSFMDVLRELERAYREEPDLLKENSDKVTQALSQGQPGPEKRIEFPEHFPPPLSIAKAIEEHADKENGGFGKAPKFPHFAYMEWAMEQMLDGMISPDLGTHYIKTMENMLMGGVFDHIRGGVHRYSVDDQYLVPHFEKMLYDQSGLLRVLAKMALVAPSVIVLDSLIKTLDYLEAEMLDENGFFFSAQDADSEGREGLYFTYTHDEIKELISKTLDNFEVRADLNSETLQKWLRLESTGNFEEGLSVISLDPKYKAEFLNNENWEVIRAFYAHALAERKTRIPPATDNKGIASWNFLMVSALADVVQYSRVELIRKKSTDLLFKVIEGCYKTFFITNNNDKMSLRHTTTLEESSHYAEDYISFAESQLRTYEITGNNIFKENFIKAMDFVEKEFVKDGILYTRQIEVEKSNSPETLMPPNQEVFPFDQSFKSPLSTYISLIRRGQVLLNNPKWGSDSLIHYDAFKQKTLMSPIGCGEGLRANTYPDLIYRVVKVPQKWLMGPKYLQFMSFFLSRFVIDYTIDESEQWQICNNQKCEKQGEGIDHFIEALTPKEKSTDPND